MSTSRLSLIHGDPAFAQSVADHLTGWLGQPPRHGTFAGCWDGLPPEADGAWILTAGDAAEAQEVAFLVQAAWLQEWRVPVVVVENPAASRERSLEGVAPHLAARFRWPMEAAGLRDWIWAWQERRRRNPSRLDLSPRERTVRHLLRLTPSLLPLADQMLLTASHDMVLLLTGETGTGKTYLARVLHECSPRRGKPFLTVPCGALPGSLVESAFFGHVKGAFTGADRPAEGKFTAAAEGTILLDEIDTLGLKEQAGLLRIIETGEYEPVGSNETHQSRARVLVASNVCLEEAVSAGRFRQDLFYRLNVMSFHLPALRERVQDIGPLARGVVARSARQFRKRLLSIHPNVLGALNTFSWPGNIRQLQNVMQQAVLMCDGPELRLSHLPPFLHPSAAARTHVTALPLEQSLNGSRELLERSMIRQALEDSGYCRVRAARSLGISRVTLYKKLKKYGLESVPLPSSPPENGIRGEA